MTGEASALVEQHMSLASKLAWAYAREISHAISVEDLEAVGLEALCVAAAGFDRSRGKRFSSWAQSKIWWAMQDFARRDDPNSRRARVAFAVGDPVTAFGHEVLPIMVGELRDDLYGTADIGESVCTRIDMVNALAEIPEREAFVLLSVAVGYEGWEIAEQLGCSASRVSQLRGKGSRTVAQLVAA